MAETEWAVQFDGHEPYRIGDIPIVELQRIADKHGVRWGFVYQMPTADSGVWLDVVEYAAGQLGVEFTRPETTRDTFAELAKSAQVDIDMPTLWTDGNPPEADEPTTV